MMMYQEPNSTIQTQEFSHKQSESGLKEVETSHAELQLPNNTFFISL